MTTLFKYGFIVLFCGLLLGSGPASGRQTDSWAKTKADKFGRIEVGHYGADPFVYRDSDGDLRGIESDLFQEFVQFVGKEYGVRLEVSYRRAADFSGLYQEIKNGRPGMFGISSFSITEERKKEVRFSPPYIPDYQVLVSSTNVPIVNNTEEFVRVFRPLTALIVKKSTYEENLLALEEYLPEMRKEYIKNVDEEIAKLAQGENYYGYIELVQYLMLVKQGRHVRRQNLFKVKKDGYGFIFPMSSDWDEPMERFFAQPATKEIVNRIVVEYLGQKIRDISLQAADSSSGNREIELLTNERELQTLLLKQQMLEKRDHERQRNLLIIGFIFLVISAATLYNRYRLKQRANLALHKKNREIDAQKVLLEKNNRLITESIRYAKRIQDAVLPSEKELTTVFPEHFVFFRPRNIVSGDFYWLDTIIRNQEEIRILAVADCTGHGVPGAFMSMLGTQALGDIVSRRQISEPGEVLAALHRLIGSVLKQETSGNRDGMDMSLISWHEKERLLEFAGAKNPLLYTENEQLKKIKGSPYPVGDEHAKRLHKYETHRLILPENTFIYLFTDGYPDQFGGPDKLKFMQKNFRNLLQSFSTLPADKQHLLLDKTLTDWQQAGNETQTDDILVVGLRL